MADLARQLPETYRRSLELKDSGCSHAAIAAELGVPTESVPAILQIAAAKLAHVAAVEGGHTLDPRRDDGSRKGQGR